MFFYPTVLNHRTGRFATIWLAATKGRKISRRDLLKVNVHNTCNDIMDFVLVRVPPPMAGLPRPRFSLYLSSQLQYGVVLVFHRQCEFLLEDTQGAIDKLLRLNRKANIDLMEEDTRQSHMIPDAVALFDETEGARDPFFGIMEYGLPSPSSLIQRREKVLLESVPPAREPSPPSDGITASQESITLTEPEPLIMPEPQFEGADLQEANMIELLLEQPDHFLEREDERQMEIDRDRERTEEDRELMVSEERELERAALERETARDLTISASLDLAQITGASSQDAVLLPEEDLGLPMEMPVIEEREKTPVSAPVPIPSPPPEEETGVEPRRQQAVGERSPRLEAAVLSPEPEVKKRRRRQLLFVDEYTQISQDEMRARINDVETMTRPLESIIPPSIQKKDARELLTNPCMSLPPEILTLWKQAAVVKPIPPSEQRWEIPEAEETLEREEEECPQPPEPEVDQEISSTEIPREMAEPELFQQETPASLVELETTDRDVSPSVTPEMRRSPVPEIQFGLEDIPEERVPEMEDITMDVEELRPEDVHGDLATFESLLPPQASRRIVAQMFWRLLEETVAGQVTVRQDEPYGDIIIAQL
ncbi:meiotic recombination protein REC8 homolog isoform X2 [Danio rerio]|uniref:Meiotic recombination protein REC8 homolog isoform X2 n=1 Tax=Danio rerio TaxID=7955 RepID=A0AC58HAM1_DANRE|nr:meiotic recombination protein REC8 homolog [Danio rerio]|eukprot:XP_017214597.1 meiotic recombination protein REC8 homolog [Danio rerio]